MAIPRPRPHVARMHGYVPGEQPKEGRWIKLNTNENPYPPAPGVLAAVAALGPDQMRKYPPPTGERLRGAIAGDLGVTAAHLLVANGSDELLRMAVDAFADRGDRVAYLWPTYSLYPVLVEMAGAVEVRLPWSENGVTQEMALAALPPAVRVLFVTNPNPPVGLPVDVDVIRALAKGSPETLIVVDEAYVAYGGASALPLVRDGLENVLVARTFSKSHSLAGMRVGFGVGHPALIDVLMRIKDSYNVGIAGQTAAQAAWSDAAYLKSVVLRVRATRERLSSAMRDMGFAVAPSAGNFIFARGGDARAIYQGLRDRRILVRYFDTPELKDGLRISIGTDEEIDELLQALREIHRPAPHR